MPTTAVPPILTTLVGRLAGAVPRRARTTFTELLLGAAATRGGHVTDAILAAGLSRSWTTYYWFLQRYPVRKAGQSMVCADARAFPWHVGVVRWSAWRRRFPPWTLDRSTS